MAMTIMTVFQGKLAQDLATIAAQLTTGDLAAVNRAAHKIKGSRGSIGALALQAAASDLENAARAGEDARCHALAATLDAASRAFLAAAPLDRLRDHLSIDPQRSEPCGS
jgi:HPt (histidine-containing phosphotransfer) domain-containing protein